MEEDQGYIRKTICNVTKVLKNYSEIKVRIRNYFKKCVTSQNIFICYNVQFTTFFFFIVGQLLICVRIFSYYVELKLVLHNRHVDGDNTHGETTFNITHVLLVAVNIIVSSDLWYSLSLLTYWLTLLVQSKAQIFKRCLITVCTNVYCQLYYSTGE